MSKCAVLQGNPRMATMDDPPVDLDKANMINLYNRRSDGVLQSPKATKVDEPAAEAGSRKRVAAQHV